MNCYKLSMSTLLSAFILISPVSAQKFIPNTTPIVTVPHAKPNMHLVLDDSASMKMIQDTYLEEHAYGFGEPICEPQSAEWHNERKALGEYDPFQTGNYVPWDEYQSVDGWINGKKRPPKILKCQLVTRSTALEYAVTKLLQKYRDNSYMGVSFLWQVNDKLSNKQADAHGLLRIPIGDFSELSDKEFTDQVIAPLAKMIHLSPGNTPMEPAVYEMIKMFRGQPLTAAGANGSSDQDENRNTTVRVTSKCNGTKCYYPYVRHETPLRYRCQTNNMIVMTDGVSNRKKVFGIDPKDKLSPMKYLSGTSTVIQGVNISSSIQLLYKEKGSITSKELGRITSTMDLRTALKPILVNDVWVEKVKDDAGKDWNDALSVKMPIYMHSVSMYVDPKSKLYTEMTEPTNGLNLGFGENSDGTAEDLLHAFDDIFSAIIRTTSSTLGTNDRLHGEVLDVRPEYSGDAVDMSTVGTIRYDTGYNFNQRLGNLRAMVPYIDSYNGKGDPVISLTELWSTDDTIQASDARYLTFLEKKNSTGSEFSHLTDKDVKKQFSEIYETVKSGNKFDDSYIDWLVDFEQKIHPNHLRGRTKPMGSITNSDIVVVNKDVLNIDITHNKMSNNLSNELLSYLKYKAANQPLNYVIVSDNDGFINFINAQRGLTNRAKGGARNTAYFPQLLMHRIDEIAKDNRPATLVLEGRTNVVDGKIYQKGSLGDMYASLGLSGMGSGGKGIVGYRIYAVQQKNMKKSASERASINAKDPIDKILPMFEITNQGPEKYRTKGFEDLGYTYSGFGFFNRLQQGNNRGQIVAIFGNGFGTDKSVLYFIDAYTGEKLHQIILNNKGGGASTPEIIVSKDPDGNGQMLERIYVGDYSGNLYRIEFKDSDFTNNSKISVTNLFQAAQHSGHYGQSAISTKPLVTKSGLTNLYQVSFGTGNASSAQLDRGKNSLVEHGIYSIIDHNDKDDRSTKTVAELSSSTASSLLPLLTIDDLKVGGVKYAGSAKVDYLKEEMHPLIIETPIQRDPSIEKDNGWAIRLIADGMNSGERVIQDPKYDAVENTIVFATWGVYEQSLVQESGIYDPCLKDAIFGKILSFNSKTGSGGKTGKKGVQSQAVTDRALGGLTGEGIQTSPEGNQVTDLDQLDGDVTADLQEIIGGENSTYFDNPNHLTLQCVGGIYGKTECVDSGRAQKKKLTKKRISVKEIYRY